MELHNLPPGSRESVPEAFRHAYPFPVPAAFFSTHPPSTWQSRPPTSQSRPYVSPDTSPVDLPFEGRAHGSRPVLAPSFPLRGRPLSPLFQSKPQAAVHAFSSGTLGIRYHAPPPPRCGSPEGPPFYNAELVVQSRPTQSKKSRAAKKADGKQPTFLTKLFALLEQEEYQHIIRWDESGESIIIESPDELAEKILPVVYRQSRFASFSRQLNIYGFNRRLSPRNLERGLCDPDASTWSHPFLRRDSSQDEIISFKRRVPPRPSQPQKRRASTQSMPEEALSPSFSERSLESYSPPDPTRRHFPPDLEENRLFMMPTREQPLLSIQYDTNFHNHFHVSPSTAGQVVDQGHASPEGHRNRPAFISIPSCALEAARHISAAPPGLFQDPNGRDEFYQVPQTAPANTISIQVPVRVKQEHTRTRSVQGEPPSATLFSPFFPTRPATHLPGSVSQPSLGDVKEEECTRSTSRTAWDAWSPARDLIDLGGDFRVPRRDIPPLSSGHHSLPAGPPGDGYALGLKTHFMYPSASETSPVAVSTVSPGIYQSGFSYPIYGKRPIPAVRAATPQRYSYKPSTIVEIPQERRCSAGSHPYTPRTRPPLLSYGKGLRTIASRRGSEAPVNGLELQLGEVDTYKGEEQELPSASVKLEDQHPFKGILEGGGDGDPGKE
ncbi:hypothetical protein IAR55_000120 [Kwoniella newhampshirensis]|uniref:HSF-type DNA-binding domain-containing protein n=1 Tax=Kwoniella newhampshirensis TaxID=1651941 RepID=A0AAW0Z5R6_9TREE